MHVQSLFCVFWTKCRKCQCSATQYSNNLHNDMTLSIMDRLHWHCLLAKPSATMTLDSTCIGHLGWCDTDRIVSIYVMPPKVTKASTMVTVMCRCHCHYHRRYPSKLRQCKHSLMDLTVTLSLMTTDISIKCHYAYCCYYLLLCRMSFSCVSLCWMSWCYFRAIIICCIHSCPFLQLSVAINCLSSSTFKWRLSKSFSTWTN